MRLGLTCAGVLLAANLEGAVTFVSPQEGSQAIGSQVIEVTTDAANIDRVEFHVDGILAGVARTAPFRILHDFGAEIHARKVEAKVLSDGYRTSESAEITLAPLSAGETMTVDLVEVPMRVRSSAPLGAADFRLRENSREQVIRDVLPTRGPAHFAFVIDRSLSMGEGRLEAAIRSVRQAKGLLRPDDTTSAVLFNHRVTAAQSLTSLSPDEVSPSGGTSLRDAVASTLDSSGRRTFIIVITDGGDRNSELSDEAALREISGTRTTVSAVVLGNASTFLKRAAAMTGGALVRSNKNVLHRDVTNLIADINGRLTVVYQSTASDPGWRSIEVEARRGVEILSARTRYFAE